MRQPQILGPTSGLPYTDEEDALIFEHYESSGSKKLTLLLSNRNKQSIINRARKLGLNCQLGAHYTEEENKLIAEHYPAGGVEAIAKMIRRSPQSIHSQAHKLGIKITDELKIQLRNKNFRKSYKGTDSIPGSYFSRIKAGASSRGLEYSLSNENLEELMNAQGFKCALSDIAISFPERRRGERQNYSASLDRIDSAKGYVEGNVQWVHKDINIMKNDHDQEYFLELCKKITEWKAI